METRRLDELCVQITDCPHSTPQWLSSGKLVLRNFNIHNGRIDLSNVSYTDDETFFARNKRATPIPGDIVMSREAPMGEVAIIPNGFECCLGQRMVLLHPDTTVCNGKFLMYSLLSPFVQKQIKRSDTTGSVVSNLCIPDLCALEIPYVNIERQECIVALLSDIDSKIDNNNAIAAELEGMAKDLYDYWFVQFDFPDENGKPYKSSGGKMVWNEEMKREIPEGWDVRKLGQIFNKILDGISPLQKGELPYTPMDCLPSKKMSFGGTFDNTEASSSLIKYRAGDVLFGAMRAYFHRVCIAPFDGITRTTTFVLRPQKSHLLGFAYETINQDIAVEYASKHSVGTQQPYAEWENSFASFKFAMPPEELALKYSKIIAPSIKMVCYCMSENAELTSLRDFLLPMLMNGQVKVKGVS